MTPIKEPPKPRIADRQILALKAALEKTNGDPELTAKMMGWPTAKVKSAMDDVRRHLPSKWLQKSLDTPSPASTVHRKDIPETDDLKGPGLEDYKKLTPEKKSQAIVLSAGEASLAAQINQEDIAVRKGLKAMGLSPEEMDEAVAIQAFHRDFFRHSIELIGGGITRSSVKLRTQLTEIEKRLDVVRSVIHARGNQMDQEREKWVKEEEVLMRAHSKATLELTRIFDISMKGAYIMALIRSAKRVPVSNGKPGYTLEA